MELNGYYFRNILKKTRRRFALCAGEQALYQELVAICNDENWQKSFQVSNGELTTALCCNEKTLNAWRQSLINAGLIKYNSGKSKRAFGLYEMVVEKVVKITTNTSTDRGTNPTTNPSDYNKLKETKRNLSSVGKKPTVKKRKPDPAETTEHWKALVEEWLSFYQQQKKEKPTFDGPAPAFLKKIVDRLKKRAEDKKYEWTEQRAVKWLNEFFKAALADKWLNDNFLLPNLDKFFDKIILNQNGHTPTPANGAKAKSGGSIEELQGLKRNTGGIPSADTHGSGNEDPSIGADWQEAVVVE